MKLKLRLLRSSGDDLAIDAGLCFLVLEIRQTHVSEHYGSMKVRIDLRESYSPEVFEPVMVVSPMTSMREFPFSNTVDMAAHVCLCISKAFTEDHEAYHEVFYDKDDNQIDLEFEVPNYCEPVVPDGALDHRGRP